MVPPFLSFLFLLPVCVMAQQHAADLTPLPPGMDELGTGAAGFRRGHHGAGDLMLITAVDNLIEIENEKRAERDKTRLH